MSETAMKRQAIPKGKKSVGRNFDKKKAIDPQLSGEAEHIARIANSGRRMLGFPASIASDCKPGKARRNL
jgi:hypothetical protein